MTTKKDSDEGALHMSDAEVDLAIIQFNQEIVQQTIRVNTYLNSKPRFATGYKSKYSGTMS